MCYMETISHRDMRNHSGELLRRVQAGESVVITSRGQSVAIVSPIGRNVLDDLEERGQLRRARRPVAALAEIQARPSSLSSAEIIDDARGSW